jgi:hypothetical protein
MSRPVLDKVQKNVEDGTKIYDEPESPANPLDVITQRRLTTTQNTLNVLLLFPRHENQIQNISIFLIQKIKNRLEEPDLIQTQIRRVKTILYVFLRYVFYIFSDVFYDYRQVSSLLSNFVELREISYA